MVDGIDDSGFTFLSKETLIERSMGHTSSLCQGSKLIVCQITGVVAKTPAVAMTANYRCTGNLQRIIEALLPGMGEVNHQTAAVHLLNDLFAKLADTIVGVAAAGRVADIVVTIMTERDIDDTPLSEMLHIGQFVTESQAVLNTKHDAATPFALVFIKVLRRTGNAEITAVGLHDILNLIENGIGIGRWRNGNRG